MFTYYNHYGSVTRNANVVCPRDARAIEVLRGETHFSVLGSKARAGELTGGTPVRCLMSYKKRMASGNCGRRRVRAPARGGGATRARER